MIQALAYLSMYFDHIGLLFHFPLLRLIGRFAFPAFQLGVIYGCHFTSNHSRYLRRLFIWGVVSQIPFNLFQYHVQVPFTLNIYFQLFALSLGIIAFSQNKIYMCGYVCVAFLIASISDYGIPGLVFGLLLAYIIQPNYPKIPLYLAIPRIYKYSFYPLHLLFFSFL